MQAAQITITSGQSLNESARPRSLAAIYSVVAVCLGLLRMTKRLPVRRQISSRLTQDTLINTEFSREE